jgi:hypothetical protein
MGTAKPYGYLNRLGNGIASEVDASNGCKWESGALRCQLDEKRKRQLPAYWK